MSGAGGPLLEAVQKVTIFGFNTDIRSGDTVYHVQTEAHETECSMQTAVFVRGRCIGKYSSSYGSEAEQPDLPQHVHELLKQQHRFVLSSIREGRIETLLNTAAAGRTDVACADRAVAPFHSDPSVASPEETLDDGVPADMTSDDDNFVGTPCGETPLSPNPISIEFVSSKMQSSGTELLMRFRVVSGPVPVEGAKLTARLDVSGSASAPSYSQTVSDCEGEAHVRFGLESEISGVPLTVLVQTAHRGASAVRRFRLRRS